MAAFDDIFGCGTTPERCAVRYGDVETTWARSGRGEWRQVQVAAGARGLMQELVV
ncbi:MAG: hypothetical protein OXU63_02390 [Acidobacteriota bacterium]|nr:hypothetical protein [Acidobacteriota bacterium]